MPDLGAHRGSRGDGVLPAATSLWASPGASPAAGPLSTLRVRPRGRQVSGTATFSPPRPGRKQFRKPGAEAVTASNTCQGPEGGCDPCRGPSRAGELPGPWDESGTVSSLGGAGGAASKWVTGLTDTRGGLLPALAGHCGGDCLPGARLQVMEPQLERGAAGAAQTPLLHAPFPDPNGAEPPLPPPHVARTRAGEQGTRGQPR